MTVADLLIEIVGEDSPVRIEAYDASSLGPTNSSTTIRILSPLALQHVVAARGREIGFARAIVAGEIEIDGDVFGLFDINDRVAQQTISHQLIRPTAELLGITGLRDLLRFRPPPPPPEEIKLRGRLHSRERDAEAISSHYDVSNSFYEIVLGRAMTYSCAVFERPDDALFTSAGEQA